MKTEKFDFELAAAADQAILTTGQNFNVYAKLKNLSYTDYHIAYYVSSSAQSASCMGLTYDGWVFDPEEPSPPPPSPVLKFISFDTYNPILDTFNISVNQKPGIYELYVSARFYLNWNPSDEQTWIESDENKIEVASNKIILIVQ